MGGVPGDGFDGDTAEFGERFGLPGLRVQVEVFACGGADQKVGGGWVEEEAFDGAGFGGLLREIDVWRM